MARFKRHSCYIIAEAGVNHNGSVPIAKELIDVAAEAGADAVKFQTFIAEKVISRYAPKADYQKKTTDETESQVDMVKKLELNEGAHRILIDHCRLRNVTFLSTPFDFESVDLLAYKLDLPCIKIPSGEITNGPFLLHIAQTGKDAILSTGMSTIDEVETALSVLAFGYLAANEEPSFQKFHEAFLAGAGRKLLEDKVTLLHCTTDYPASFDEVNLRAMHTMHEAFGLPVGLSDHTAGIAVPIAAAALGAAVIEKHFTLDRSLPGPDHKASLEPHELGEMIKGIRNVEAAMGTGQKAPTASELKNRDIARKSLTAANAITVGETFTAANLTMKRPGNGLSPMKYWELIGKKSSKDYDIDMMI